MLLGKSRRKPLLVSGTLTSITLSHIAEEIPNPGRNVPIAIGTQMAIGFATGLFYIIAIMYAISDYDALFESAFPIAEIYRQATGSSAGAIGLLLLVLLCVAVCMVGVYVSCPIAVQLVSTSWTARVARDIGVMLWMITLTIWDFQITAGRTLWTLARDGATPFPKVLGRVSPKLGMPLFSTLTCGVLVTILGW